MKEQKRSKEMNRKQSLKDSADDFIQSKNERINLNGSYEVSEQSEYLKRTFLERKKKLSSFIPKEKSESKDHFCKLGSFRTNIGRISVGFEKFRGHPKFRFTLISQFEDDYDDKYSMRRFDDDHNYFKKNYEGEEREYKENNTTVEFDPQEENLSKVYEDHMDNKIEDDSEMLYDDLLEDMEIKYLKDSKTSKNSSSLDEAISDMREIKNEKKKDNLEFERDLKKFISSFMNNKLKKFEDADQLYEAKIRISYNDLDIIKKRMEEMMKLRKKLCRMINFIISKKKGVD